MTWEQAKEFKSYRLGRLLGSGGMARVYEAEKLGTGGFSTCVAIKVLDLLKASDRSHVEWFIDEARLGSYFDHENIVKVRDFGHHEGHYFIEMEFIDGPTLQDILTFHRRSASDIPPEIVINVVCQMLSGLEHAHSHEGDDGKGLNVVHRDLKPSNILMTHEGQLKIVDFGVARADNRLYPTVANADEFIGKGTVNYMSPEQADGSPNLNLRSDVYSVGLLLFELLTLRRLYDGEHRLAALKQAMLAEVEGPLNVISQRSSLQPFDAVLRKALARQVDQRFESARAMRLALLRLGIVPASPPILDRWLRAATGRASRLEPATAQIPAGPPLEPTAVLPDVSPQNVLERTVQLDPADLDPEHMLVTSVTSSGAVHRSLSNQEFSQEARKQTAIPGPVTLTTQSVISSGPDRLHAVEPTSVLAGQVGAVLVFPSALPTPEARSLFRSECDAGRNSPVATTDSASLPGLTNGAEKGSPAVREAVPGAAPDLGRAGAGTTPNGVGATSSSAPDLARSGSGTTPKMNQPSLRPASENVEPESAPPLSPRGWLPYVSLFVVFVGFGAWLRLGCGSEAATGSGRTASMPGSAARVSGSPPTGSPAPLVEPISHKTRVEEASPPTPASIAPSVGPSPVAILIPEAGDSTPPTVKKIERPVRSSARDKRAHSLPPLAPAAPAAAVDVAPRTAKVVLRAMGGTVIVAGKDPQEYFSTDALGVGSYDVRFECPGKIKRGRLTVTEGQDVEGIWYCSAGFWYEQKVPPGWTWLNAEE